MNQQSTRFGVHSLFLECLWVLLMTTVVFVLHGVVVSELISRHSTMLSDYPVHGEYVENLFEGGKIKELNVPHPVYHIVTSVLMKVLGVSNVDYAQCISVSVALTGTFFLVYLYFRNKMDGASPLIVSIFSLMVCFATTTYNPIVYFYPQHGSILHNPTYIYMKFFSLIHFVMLLSYMRSDWYSWKLLNASVLASLLVLCTLTKPSYTFGVCVVYFVYFVLKINTLGMIEKIACALQVLPSLLVVMIQYWMVYKNIEVPGVDPGSGVVVDWPKLFYLKHSYCLNGIVFSLVSMLMFPVSYVLLLRNERVSLSFDSKCALLFYLVQFFIFLFVKETGVRELHGNFGWGYAFAYFLLFVVLTKDLYKLKGRFLVSSVLFFHFANGIVYFLKVSQYGYRL